MSGPKIEVGKYYRIPHNLLITDEKPVVKVVEVTETTFTIECVITGHKDYHIWKESTYHLSMVEVAEEDLPLEILKEV